MINIVITPYCSTISMIFRVNSLRAVVHDIVGGHNGFTDAYKVLRSHRSPCSIIILGLGTSFLWLCVTLPSTTFVSLFFFPGREVSSRSLLLSRFFHLPSSSSSSSAFSSPFRFRSLCFSHVLHQDHPSFLHLSLSLARLFRLLSTACQHNAS